MRIDKALEQITEIHEHLARSQIYCGYRAMPSTLAGLLALVAAWVQPLLVSNSDPRYYVLYWTLVALVAFLVIGGNIIVGHLREKDPYTRGKTSVAVGQLAPSLWVGVIVTIALTIPEDRSPISFLPALWALLYGLGLFASKPFLPKTIGWVALFYLLCGCALLRRTIGPDYQGLSPWETGLPFGIGHILSGVVLYLNLERRNHES